MFYLAEFFSLDFGAKTDKEHSVIVTSNDFPGFVLRVRVVLYRKQLKTHGILSAARVVIKKEIFRAQSNLTYQH